ncbi:MAG: cbb3-type cytochrome c oxidase subunit I [Saprospiraceae bacterium]|jgi:cytochrome c oxidase cbb3-type subunit 1|uniref:cbb3-type cytochrome c oxidase subunit I n=1 Tax=Candidatus Brachybacter algidus TaxID=2982024 RepID=UPI001B7A8D8C|nr:cbb3-type cytochrome c oxidase subunit I [Candidatus Brachybacter algidus]MBP7304896.1 cbb3-type cytochrome c oxidase subunit I [Saprospiraceae bacterium]MBK6373367.1 cbb3-type cytochrome c oxidase subunit I [Candidatus Brachybacter algidus]MBK6448015.1 cbb3-type cytochrome c oxidase subunit I [Candidatus Brachybacter algidus]MBK8602147.1 cbb3-type cytochrome c oxidase subunit I [Candidatus Brachybacter algidus]MBK8750036.1 cbb3-type cytochrome c oxidase subunit I [Candidatus Brachybacter a
MESKSILSETGIIITIILVLIPLVVASIIIILKAFAAFKNVIKRKELEKFNTYLKRLSPEEALELEQRQKELEFNLKNNELAGDNPPQDSKGLISNVSEIATLRFIEQKKRSQPRPNIEPDLTKMILWYIGCAIVWLLFGTTVGEYVGIKFVTPDIDSFSWLSFGRLRPVHTNAVFWGWSSLAMMGLAYYVVPRVSNVPIFSIKIGYWTLGLINASVVLGSICLMAGINNSGGEYREYIWPIMLLFGIGIIISLINFFKTIANRTSKEIYVSNWYIISAMMFVIVIAVVAYVPTWQNGLGETIVQGYYMHQGVGMWFMLFSLGLMYYFLPQQLNKPIYSYSLGILAFWTQILFYTLIGTHHFIFSSIPWWLQTIAIVGSVGMIIPVVAGTTNFLMTFKGSWNKISGSYTLPFYLIGIIFYFTGSLQGTAEAFRFTNLAWHFTDFTVAHSHLTMYGIIAFMLWGFIYTIVPRLTGREPSQILVGAHFWLAFIGLLFYTFPLMYGSTLKGLMWMDGAAFIDSVTLMAPYWLWRAIGGSLMWISHIIFAYNFYEMVSKKEKIEIPKSAIEILKAKSELDKKTS